ILLFDNGAERGFSRVVEMDPSTGNIIWEFKTPDPKDFYSLSRGAAQRLGNGNTLIADSDHGRAFEITPAGEVVWDFLCPYKSPDGNRASIVRMRRLDHQFVDNLIKRTASADKSKTP
ncbi:hypothetical protein HYR69_08850, partial [Candidatus Sumerlaeota bacterium]|nr:hypothetical protein [Candidatus Sumerlaeota bacterium]